ncbi:MAG: class I SAM-dependent methyltransferase [Deltaproteobacteria bacterium]|nr:class I SAM-dependent methyltransferase [Deltaproteobacteria bacterium]
MLPHMLENKEIFACPGCGGDLQLSDSSITCGGCSHTFPVEHGIPLLFWPNEWEAGKTDVTHEIKAFYEENPFPNYDGFERVGDLVQKAEKSGFARMLNEQIPFNVRVLEAGCGTGQLSNYLGVAHRVVFGTDICLNSLRLAQQFKEKNDLNRVGFYQMNLFRPIFKPESFSLVICNGVLHHTSDPFSGFQSLAKLVKKGGYILIGLYNRYGRLVTDLRRLIFRIFSDRFKFLDPRLRGKDIGDLKKTIWFMDQYKNPSESKHTMGEVLRWFGEAGFDFVNGIPKLTAFSRFAEKEKLFRQNPPGSRLDHFLVQTGMIFSGSKEGGLFVMIGRKKS